MLKLLTTTTRFIFVLLLMLSCKKDKDNECTNKPKAEAYITDVFEFYVMDGGSGDGFCGPVIVAKLDSTSITNSYFKAIDLPPGISVGLFKFYRGKFRVLPEQYRCMDGWGDPLPGQLPRTIYPNFVNIISWEKK